MSKIPIAGINEKDYSGRTPLQRAVADNDLARVQWLLTVGADLNIKNKNNFFEKTLLHEVAENNENESHFGVAEVLLNHGANVNARDNQGQTPFYLLARAGNMRMIQLFLNFNVNLATLDDRGSSFLFPAFEYNDNLEVLQLLIDLGLDVDHADSSDSTLLHWGCRGLLEYEKIKLLLKNGARTRAPDNGIVYNSVPLVLFLDTYRSQRLTKEVKKIMSLMLEVSEFGTLYMNDKSYIYKHDQDDLWKMFLRHIAKLEVLKIPVHFSTLRSISSKFGGNEYYERFYEQCKTELLRAKSTKLESSWVTFYNLLIDGRKKLKNYAGNKELIGDFEKSDCVKNFPLYGPSMIENVKKGTKRRQLFDKSSIKFSKCCPIFNPNHLIVKDVLDCVLSKKDLLKLSK